jgi:predicted ATP-grasp superfamily ATP-dependent carboligase
MTPHKLPPVLLVESFNNTLGITIATCLRKISGLSVHLLRTGSGESNGFWLDGLSRFVRTYTQVPAPCREEETSAVKRAVQRTGARVLMPVDEFSIEMCKEAAALLGPELHLAPLPPSDALRKVMDKSDFSEYLAEEDLPRPKTWSCWDLGRVPQEAGDEDFPLLAKPTQGQGGIGITELATRADLEHFLAWQESTGSSYIIQKKASDPTVDINVFFDHGRLVASCCQETLDSRRDTYSFPKSIRMHQDQAIQDLAQKLLGPLDWHGVAHVDMIRDKSQEQPLILEVNPRFWSTIQGSCLAGMNFPAFNYFTALGLPIPKTTFTPITYNHSIIGLKNSVRRRLSGKPFDFRLRHSSLLFSFTDPIKSAARIIQKTLRSFHSRKPPSLQLLYAPDSDMHN